MQYLKKNLFRIHNTVDGNILPSFFSVAVS